MKVVGHRGCAGIEPENTLKAIKRALSLGVDAVEFDVRVTRDRQLVLCHDADLNYVAATAENIRDLTLRQIIKVKTLSGEPITKLSEALDILDGRTVFIEPKDSDVFEELMSVTADYPNVDIRYTTREHELLKKIKQARPKSKIYPTNDWLWYKASRQIKKLDADGISINYKFINRLTYWLVSLQKVEIMIFTVDEPNQIEKAGKLFNSAWLCTNRPDIALKLNK